MSIHVVIQARIVSTRLPRKALLEITPGVPMLRYLYDNLSKSRYPVSVIMPTEDADEREFLDFAHFIGEDANNVMGRYATFAEQNLDLEDYIIRVTGDCPLLAPRHIHRFVLACERKRPGLIITNRPKDPDGFDLELFSVEDLLEVYARLRDTDFYDSSIISYYLEHVTPILYDTMSTERVHCVYDYADARKKYSVDTYDEFEAVKSIIQERKND